MAATETILRPNIVFIMADDLGYADLSCCGRRDFSTPNIDRIAERGTRERGNMKHRREDVFDRLVAAWEAWNGTMLAEIPDSFGEVFTAADLADHIGA